MRNYFLFFFFIITGAVLAQSTVFSGIIVSKDGNPIPLVNVFSEKSSNGCFSDIEGRFSLILSNKNQKIELSHVGYKTIQYAVDLKNYKGDSLYQHFVMEKDVEALAELELKGNEIRRAYNRPNIRILDFDFYDDGFIMLIAEEKGYKLRWIDSNETLVYDIDLDQHPKDLYKDCYNNFFVVYRATVAQVFVNEEKRWLEKTCSMLDFNTKIKNCVVASGDYVYISEYSKHNQGIKYYKWNKKEGDVSLFSAIFDKYGYANASGEMALINSLGGSENSNPMLESKVSVRTSRKIAVLYEFYKNILSKPEYQPLLPLNNELFLCNHISDTIYVHHFDGRFKRSFPIDYHKKKGWKALIVDANGSSLFARCRRDGMAYLLEIDTNTGAVIGTTQLKKHTFPATVRIKDHIAYYLYKDNGYFTETNIYQQNLR